MMGLPLALGAAGTALSAYGSYRAGKSVKRQRQFEAAQMERLANRAVAASQREAQEYERQGQLQLSRALAVSAASGGGATDPTMLDIFGDIAGDTSYRKAVALYEGQTEADRLRLAAATRKEEGQQAWEAGKLGAFGTALAGGSSLYAKYGESEIKPWLQKQGENLAGLWWQLQTPGPRKL